MKVAVFGANGDSGREITLSLVERGHTVVAVVRRPETITPTEHVEVKKLSNVYDAEEVASVLEGCDAVVSALGSGKIPAAAKPTKIYSQGTKSIRTAMAKVGSKRLIVLSSGGVEYDPHYHWFYL